jgi:hypothetical protein
MTQGEATKAGAFEVGRNLVVELPSPTPFRG